MSVYIHSKTEVSSESEIKRDRQLREALDNEHPLITAKHTDILDCIP